MKTVLLILFTALGALRMPDQMLAQDTCYNPTTNTMRSFNCLRTTVGTAGVSVFVVGGYTDRDSLGGYFSWCDNCYGMSDNGVTQLRGSSWPNGWIWVVVPQQVTVTLGYGVGRSGKAITADTTKVASKQYVDSKIAAIPVAAGTNIGNSKSGTTVTLTSSTGTGSSFDVADNDNSATNEFQSISFSKSGNIVTGAISSGTGGQFSVADGDSSNTNEFQTLSGTGNTVNLSNGGGSYTIPAEAYS